MDIKDINKKSLSTAQAQTKLKENGYNEIRRKKLKTKFEIFIGILKDPILIIMMAAMFISILSGYEEKSYNEALVIGALIAFNIILSFVQEVKTQQKLEALDALNEDYAIVLRDGIEKKIPSKEIVVDDIVKVEIGTIVRADLKMLNQKNLQIDESFLTGESKEVYKEEGDIVYSNSKVIDGTGYGIVIATGMDTEIGNITKQVDDIVEEKSQLELKILQISKKLLIIAIITALIIGILTKLNGSPFDEILSITISILIATVPEGLATVLTIVLTFMSQRMAHNNALIKKVSLLETLGEVQYVCSDKTGTITKNKMTVSDVKNFNSNELTLAIKKTVVDKSTPTMAAINKYLSKQKVDQTLNILDYIPFNSTTKRSLYLLEDQNAKRYLVCLGAPDFLVTQKEIKEIKEYAIKGLRTLLIMYKETDLTNLKDYDIYDAHDFNLISLYGIQDPPKKSAVEAIKIMHEAGINTVMITGDNIDTANSIAKQSGIIQNDKELSLTGDELAKLTDEQFLDIVQNVKVYARVKPEDKYRIVSALQKLGNIVAMTGDGTNDSIALKKANVGISMGQQGTDIAKESSDLILLDDNFATINEAILGGRLIFDNLRKFIRQMLTSNTAHVGGILFALIFGLFSQKNIILPMTAVLILWVNIVSDAIPCLALGLDDPEDDLMKRPPIDPNMQLLDYKMIIEVLIRGLSLGLLVFISFNYVMSMGADVMVARTVAFSVLSFGQLIHIFDARSFNTIYKKNPFSNKYIIYAVLLSAALNLLIIYTPLNQMFGLTPISIQLLLFAIVVGSTVTFVLSLIKLMYLKIKNN